MIAASRGQSETIQFLIDNGAEAGERDHQGRTALSYAALAGHDETALQLEKAGAEEDLDQLLRIVAATGRADRVAVLVDDGAKVDFADSTGNTPLMLAADAGHASTVDTLLMKGADVNAVTPNGGTALMLAAGRNHRVTVDTLLAKGANPNTRTAEGRTALMMVSYEGYATTAGTLLAHGAQADLRDDEGEPLLCSPLQRDIRRPSKLCLSGAPTQIWPGRRCHSSDACVGRRESSGSPAFVGERRGDQHAGCARL